MGAFQKLIELLDDTEAVGHEKKDNVHMFGILAGIFTLISGIVFYVIMLGVQDAAWYVRDLGIFWILFACVDFFALYIFEHEDRRRGAMYLIYFGALGFVFGAGFFVGALIMIFAGMLGLKYSSKRIGKKIR